MRCRTAPGPPVIALYLVVLCFLGACQAYDVRLNDRVVYTPLPLFSDFSAADPALQRCLEKVIEREKITNANQLVELSCRDAGIAELAGLGVFRGVRQLDLAGNAISDIKELALLSALEEAYLDDNQIVDPLPLTGLQALDAVDLSGNRTLLCPNRQAFLRLARLQLPQHCG